MDSVEEVLLFLTLETRLDLKVFAMEHILGMTGREDGRRLLVKDPKAVLQLSLLVKDKVPGIARDSCLSLVNLSGDAEGADALLTHVGSNDEALKSVGTNIVSLMLEIALDPESPLADPALMILSNITRPSHLTAHALSLALGDTHKEEIDMTRLCAIMDRLLDALTATNYNTVGCNMHYLGPLLSNLSQVPSVRRYLLDHDRRVIQRLLPFTQYQDSLVRRGGIIGTIRNCCFDVDEHAWLLGSDVDILPRLLLPVAGPEEFDEEDNNKLPLDLQWLPEDKKREEDPDIRKMLLESLEQLCAKRVHRESMRDQNVYVILRELHKWEKDRQVLLACENLVDLLIRKEEEIGEDNLRELEIPDDLPDKFKKMDEDFLLDQ